MRVRMLPIHRHLVRARAGFGTKQLRRLLRLARHRHTEHPDQPHGPGERHPRTARWAAGRLGSADRARIGGVAVVAGD